MGSITREGTVHQLTQKIAAYAFKGQKLRHTVTKIMEIAYPRELTFRNVFPPHELRETCRPSCAHHAKNRISCRMSPNFAHVFLNFLLTFAQIRDSSQPIIYSYQRWQFSKRDKGLNEHLLLSPCLTES